MKPFVTVHTITYNEEVIIDFFIRHYRTMFPNCKIVIHDNYSTDRTVDIAKSYGCEIEYHESPEGREKFDDSVNNIIKANCWKNDETDWVVVCDADELIHISEDELKYEESQGITIIETTGYQMINNQNDIVDLESMEYGWQDKDYSKQVLFNKRYISTMGYCSGAHLANPKGTKINIGGSKEYVLAHYKFLGMSYSQKRRDSNNRRWSQVNLCLVEDPKDWPDIFAPDDYLEDWYNKPLVKVTELKRPFVTVYMITGNEETIMDFIIRAHRKKFPFCTIHVYDNYSTDRTVEIAKSHGCIVHYFDTSGKLNDTIKKDIQNNCWKNAKTDWVWVSDCDEVGGITQEELKHEESLGFNVIKFETWNMMNKTDDIDLKNMLYGFRNHPWIGNQNPNPYDKWWLFNKKYIAEINYKEGSHPSGMGRTQSIGVPLKYGSSNVYNAYHYKFISPEYTVKRQRWLHSRCTRYVGSDTITNEPYYTPKNNTTDIPFGYISTDVDKTKGSYPPPEYWIDIYNNATLHKILNEPLID